MQSTHLRCDIDSLPYFLLNTSRKRKKYMIKENLKQFRIKNKYTQKEIAQILGISYRTYQPYEYGQNQVPINIIYKLVALYRCSYDDLLK